MMLQKQAQFDELLRAKDNAQKGKRYGQQQTPLLGLIRKINKIA